MSGPCGLIALLVSAACGVVMGLWRGQPWWTWALMLVALGMLNAVAGVVDALLGWRLWRRGA